MLQGNGSTVRWHFCVTNYPIPTIHTGIIAVVSLYSLFCPLRTAVLLTDINSMSMTTQQLQLVKQTWKLLRDVDPAILGDVFYRRLFMEYPELRALFKEPMETQYQKFVDTLSIIVARIDRPETVMTEINQMAERHIGYGVRPEHYAPVGEVLIWMLKTGLGTDWNTEVEAAWLACYQALTQIMLEKA
jgi:hemoglobin-like flavoprotein